MTTIVTVRHAATAHNARQVITGRLDEPLSDEGRRAAAELRGLGILPYADHVIASPMSRAIETAELITGWPRVRLELDDRCVERDYGELQGVPREAMSAITDHIHYVEIGGIKHSLDPPGGESFESVRRRADEFASDLRARSGTAIVVTHQVFLQQLHGALQGLGTYAALAADIKSLQVTEFSRDGVRVLHPGLGHHASW